MAESTQSFLERRINEFVADFQSNDMEKYISWFHDDARMTNHGTVLTFNRALSLQTDFLQAMEQTTRPKKSTKLFKRL
jgi:hypothetical protein